MRFWFRFNIGGSVAFMVFFFKIFLLLLLLLFFLDLNCEYALFNSLTLCLILNYFSLNLVGLDVYCAWLFSSFDL